MLIRSVFEHLAVISLLVSSVTAVAGESVRYRREVLPLKIGSFDREVTASVWVPEGASPGDRFAALLVFGGFENAARVLELVHPRVPVILASFDYPFDPPRKLRFPDSLKYAPEVKRMVGETTEGILSLRKLLSQRPDVDPQKIAVLGASLGSPFVITAASRDPELRWVVLVHGFGDISRTATRQLMRSLEPQWRAWAYPPAWFLGQLAWWYLGRPSPETDARSLQSTQRALMVRAQADSFIPLEASAALWDGIQASQATKEQILMPGDHLQPGSEPLIEEIMGRVTDWLGRTGFFTPSPLH